MKNSYSHFVFFALMAVFILLKVPYLDLAYFWDEAWVYGPAVHSMAVSGPSLSPAAISPELGRGHPLLFHFLASAWMNIFGTTTVAAHCFALFISAGLLSFIYFSLGRMFDFLIALCSVLLLMVQPVFFTQSVLLLPEVLLAFFIAAALFSFIKGRYLLYSIYATLAILTKESAIVLFAALTVSEIISHRGKEWRFVLKNLLIVNFPVVFWLLFLLWQFSIYGWWLFPEHVSSVTFEFFVVVNKLENYFSYLFLYQGRNVLTLALLIALAIHYIRKSLFTPHEKKFLLVIVIYTMLFLLFSSINFFSNRYIISLIIIHCIVTSFIVLRIGNLIVVRFVLLFTAVISGVWNIYASTKINDHNRGYADAVKCTQSAVDFIIRQPAIENERIYTTFLTTVALTNPDAGYISKEKRLNNVTRTSAGDAQVIILNNFEDVPGFQFNNPGNEMEMLYGCESGDAAVKILRLNRGDKNTRE